MISDNRYFIGMREIRAYDHHRKVMVYETQEITKIYPDMMLGEFIGVKVYKVGKANQSLMQCTGLYDKKAVRIWEGDIVTGFSEINNHLVIYDNDRGKFRLQNYLVDIPNNRLEVIGNIFETPQYLDHGYDGTRKL
jgi:YopX protein